MPASTTPKQKINEDVAVLAQLAYDIFKKHQA